MAHTTQERRRYACQLCRNHRLTDQADIHILHYGRDECRSWCQCPNTPNNQTFTHLLTIQSSVICKIWIQNLDYRCIDGKFGQKDTRCSRWSSLQPALIHCVCQCSKSAKGKWSQGCVKRHDGSPLNFYIKFLSFVQDREQNHLNIFFHQKNATHVSSASEAGLHL